MKFIYLKIFVVIAIFNIGIFAQEYSGKLVEMNGRQVTNSKSAIDLNWRTGSLSGHAGCNRMFGSFTARGNSITFSGIGTTKMACARPVGTMAREAEFTRALGEATRYQLSRGTLRIYSGRKQTLKFERVKEGEEERLDNRKWVLDRSYGVPPRGETAPFINFDKEKGSAGGNTGCNAFGGSYNAAGERIVFSDIISTMRACVEDNRMSIERKFMDGLNRSNRFVIKNNQLFLYRNSTLLLKFNGQNK